MLTPEACADHYVFWTFHRQIVDHNVRLKGQFQKDYVPAHLIAAEHLGNPAKKVRAKREEEDIHHPSVHLLAYELEKPVEPPANAPRVKNQFTDGFETWKLGPAPFLMIPVRKAKVDEPPPTTPPLPRVDHFLCYSVVEARPIVESMALRDQFGTTDTGALYPILFGIPVSKNAEPMVHPEVHLAIYRLDPGLHPPVFNIVNTMDQLQPHKELRCVESVWLGVPSFKEWKP